MTRPSRTFAVSVHDVAPATWLRCTQLLDLLVPIDARATLLLVPRYHAGTAVDEDEHFGPAIRARIARGDEACLHGYLHHDDARVPRTPLEWLTRRVYTAGEGEFAAIGETVAATRLADGLARLGRIGVHPRGFVPPAWLLGGAGMRALAATLLRYTSTRDELIRLDDGARLMAPSLVWSSRLHWRRLASLRWNRRRLARLAAAPLLRVALHPADADHMQVMAAWGDILATLAEDRDCILEFDAIEGVGRAPPAQND